MGSFSIWHWLIVLLVVVLVFGTSKLRGIGSDLGGAIKDFKKGMRDDEPAQTPQHGQVIEGETSSGTQAKEDKQDTHV